MDTSFVCKLFEENTFLGTAFFINNNYAYTADHCFGSVLV